MSKTSPEYLATETIGTKKEFWGKYIGANLKELQGADSGQLERELKLNKDVKIHEMVMKARRPKQVN